MSHFLSFYKSCPNACGDVIADTVLGAVTFYIHLSLICVPSHAHLACVCFSIQEFHYHPRGSDTCLPCDCYPVGSFSRSCDPETGQCQCRPGVIGRQCNTCDNPFAEVTNSGCEGEWFFFSRHFGLTFGNVFISLVFQNDSGLLDRWLCCSFSNLSCSASHLRNCRLDFFKNLRKEASHCCIVFCVVKPTYLFLTGRWNHLWNITLSTHYFMLMVKCVAILQLLCVDKNLSSIETNSNEWK